MPGPVRAVSFSNQPYAVSAVLMFLQLVSNNLQRILRQEFPATLRVQPEQNHNPVSAYTRSSSRSSSIQLGESVALALVGQTCSMQLSVTPVLC